MMLIFMKIFLLIGIKAIILYPGYCAQIKSLEVPSLLRNGSDPVEFVCIYKLLKTDTELIIKWYHNLEKIYQWIPPLAPQDMGIIKGITEYPWKNINRPHSHSILRINTITPNLSGEYTCRVSTSQGEAYESKKMIVYVPVKNMEIKTASHNKTHLDVSCEVFGAHPQPKLKISMNGIITEGENYYDINYDKKPWIRHYFSTKHPEDSAIIECEISIPEVDYKRREKLFYHSCADHSTSLLVSYLDEKFCMNNST